MFLKELMLSCPILRRFILFIRISFRRDCGSFISVLFEYVRGELDGTSSMFRVVFNGILLFWITTLSPCEKRQTYSLINFLKFPLTIPRPFLLGCNFRSADLYILRKIDDFIGFIRLLFKSFAPMCKITMSGFLAMVGLI